MAPAPAGAIFLSAPPASQRPEDHRRTQAPLSKKGSCPEGTEGIDTVPAQENWVSRRIRCFPKALLSKKVSCQPNRLTGGIDGSTLLNHPCLA